MQRANGDWFALDHPFAGLNSGSIVGRRDLLIRPDEHERIEHNGNALPASFQSDQEAVEAWENEGGKTAKWA